MGFFASIAYWIRTVLLRQSVSITDAANQQFTGNAKDIHAGFSVERDRIASDFREYTSAVAGVLEQVESKKAELQKLDEEEKVVQTRLNGALAAAEQAKEGTEDYTRAEAAYGRFKERLQEIDARQEQLHTDVSSLEAAMKQHMRNLTEMQARLQRLPQEEADTIARFVSSKAIIALNQRLMNAQDSLNEGPVSTIRAQVAKLESTARITQKLVGTDVGLQDREYENIGREAESGDSFASVLAARKKQKDAATAMPQTDAPVTVSAPTDRAVI